MTVYEDEARGWKRLAEAAEEAARRAQLADYRAAHGVLHDDDNPSPEEVFERAAVDAVKPSQRAALSEKIRAEREEAAKVKNEPVAPWIVR